MFCFLVMQKCVKTTSGSDLQILHLLGNWGWYWSPNLHLLGNWGWYWSPKLYLFGNWGWCLH